MALDMMAALAAHNFGAQHQLKMRIGLSTGAVWVADAQGKPRFMHDVWRQTFESASLMQTHCLPGCIQLSESTLLRLNDAFECVERGQSSPRAWLLDGLRAGLSTGSP